MKLTRREMIRSLAISPAVSILAPPLARSAAILIRKRTDIRIEDISFAYEDYLYRTPYMFGGRAVDRVTLLNVKCIVSTRDGRRAGGFGSMTMGNNWSFPSKVMPYDTTLGAMKALAERISGITATYREYAHPIEMNFSLEPLYLRAAVEVGKELKLPEPIPKLCTLVTASPFDASLHDAYGKIHGRSCYQTYGPELMSSDLSRYLGKDFSGEYPDRYVLKVPVPLLPVYHSVGALDPIVESDIKARLNDGLPETLPEWISYNGLTHFKIKLNGNDADLDVERIVKIDRTVTETLARQNVKQWKYLLDFNENCPSVGQLLDVLRRVKEKTPAGFQRIQYVEQPTARDLKKHRSNTMHEAARLCPIVIDESLTDLESLMLGREMGYTGVALKACKGQSQAVLMSAAAQKYGMFRSVQDLTCPGASLIHSAGLASHVPGVAAIEANARQFVPAANKPWEARFPGIFIIKDGTMRTSALTGPGLSAIP
ncbi:MAG TPA: enolase C-terminal domain-like protein [Acidobacteriota bacterium]|jgi:L-alanine-DL-glutamate epimerase-like enolase superfamily enzyme